MGRLRILWIRRRNRRLRSQTGTSTDQAVFGLLFVTFSQTSVRHAFAAQFEIVSFFNGKEYTLKPETFGGGPLNNDLSLHKPHIVVPGLAVPQSEFALLAASGWNWRLKLSCHELHIFLPIPYFFSKTMHPFSQSY